MFEAMTLGIVFLFFTALMDVNNVLENRIAAFLIAQLEWLNRENIVAVLSLLTLASVVTKNTLSLGLVWLQARYIQRNLYEVSILSMRRYIDKPLSFYLSENSDELRASVLIELQRVMGGFNAMISTISEILTLGAIFIILLTQDVEVASMVFVCVLAIAAIVLWPTRNMLDQLGSLLTRAQKKRFSVVGAIFSTLKPIKITAAEEYFLRLFEKSCDQFRRIGIRMALFTVLPKIGIETLSFVLLFSVMAYAALSKADMSTVLPVIAMYGFAGYRLVPSVTRISMYIQQMKLVKEPVNQLVTHLNAETEALLDNGPGEVVSFERDIVLREICYQYPTAERPALDKVSMHIRKNSSVAIIGSSGSGKSTLVDIIASLLIPQKGQIEVDGVALRHQAKRAWRAKIGYVSQNILLTDDTLANNISFGRQVAGDRDESVRKAARLASIDDFVNEHLPEKYETMVGDNGVRLSGGQRQRVGIARALFTEPEILLFDEATSALDNATEKQISDALDRLSMRATIIIIAHRLSTIRNVDHLIILDHGKVVQSGSYEEVSQTDEFKTLEAGLGTQG